jgi:hypothetical protein
LKGEKQKKTDRRDLLPERGGAKETYFTWKRRSGGSEGGGKEEAENLSRVNL